MKIKNAWPVLALVLSIPFAAFSLTAHDDKDGDGTDTDKITQIAQADNAVLNLDDGSSDEWRGRGWGRGFGWGRGWGRGWGYGGWGFGGGWGGWGGYSYPYYGGWGFGWPYYYSYPYYGLGYGGWWF